MSGFLLFINSRVGTTLAPPPPPPPPLGGGGGYPIIPCPQVGGQAFLYDFFYFFSKKNVDQERFFR